MVSLGTSSSQRKLNNGEEINEMFFNDRKHAGKELGQKLETKYKRFNPLVIGIPRGGVEVAYYVAKQLNAELAIIVSKKLPLPTQREFGIGAIAEEHSVYISKIGKELLSPKVIDQIIEEQMEEVDRRVMKYRSGKALPDMQGRTVIIVDDGIATGVTLVPVLQLCRKKEASMIIIAAPVSGTEFDDNLKEADAIEILTKPTNYYAVGQVYNTFEDFPDESLIRLLHLAEEERNRNSNRFLPPVG